MATSRSSFSLPTPLPFQREGISWLAPRRFAYLGDRMGLGKSLQLALAAKLHHPSSFPLVLCPAIAIPQWRKLLHAVWDGSALASPPTVVSFAALQNSVTFSSLRSTPWPIIIVDEAHALQSLTSQRSRNVLGETGLLHSTDAMWFASGTPAPRGDPRQLWPILYTTGQTALGFTEFQDRYCELQIKRKKYGSKVFETDELVRVLNADELRLHLKEFMLRRHENDVAPQMPKISVERIPLEVEPLSDDFFKEWFPTFATYHSHEAGFAAFTKLFQEGERMLAAAIQSGDASNEALMAQLAEKHEVKSALQVYGLQKVPLIVETVKAELDAGEYEKIVLVAKHRSVITELAAGLKGYGCATIYGGMTETRRQHAVDTFPKPDQRVRVIQIDAAGQALDGLQVAHQMILVEKSFLHGINEQAMKRINRLNSTRPAFVRDFYAENSFEARLHSTLNRRIRNTDAMFGYS